MSFFISSTSSMFEAILVAMILALLFSWVSIRVAHRVGLMDLPNSAPHKLHQSPMPLAGGVALVSTMITASLLFGTYKDPNVLATYLAGAVVFIFGLWDDFRGISPLTKILGQTLAAVILILLGVSVRIFESPEFFLSSHGPLDVYLDWLLTVLWVVGITNAFNFVDSMDGLAVGLGGTAAAYFMLVTLVAGQFMLSNHSALIVGACVGLYFFNAPPAKMFLGDSGAQTIGLLLAVLGIAYRPLGVNQSSSWFVPVMLLGVPIFDMSLVVLSRLRRGKPIYEAARDHTYHRLLGLEWSSNRAVLGMQVAALLLGCLAFVALTRPPLVANILFASLLVCGIMAFLYLDNLKRWP